MSEKKTRQEQARERVAQMQAQEAKRRQRRMWLAGAGAAVVLAGASVGIALAASGNHGSPSSNHGSPAASSTPQLRLAPLSSAGKLVPAPAPGPNGQFGVPIPRAAPLASTASTAQGQTVDGIQCNGSEQLLYHIHVHLAIFVNGTARQVPAGVGIPSGGTCLYWLHTHAADGVIHVESPVHRTYTLGDFFDEWGQPLGPTQLGPEKGHVVVFYNGKVYQGNPRDVPLNAHAQIQLQVGTPLVAPVSITWPSGL